MILALDASTDHGAMALLDGQTVLGVRVWTAVRRGGDPLFNHWRDMMAEAGVAAEQVDTLAVGLGPGNYTGLRVSLATARLWSLPGNVPVVGVGSSLVMAVAAVETEPDAAVLPIVVVGDARRDSIWMVRYPAAVGQDGVEQPVQLIPRADWLHPLTPPAIWVSADWERLGGATITGTLPGRVLNALHGPDPVALAGIAQYRRQHDLSGPPLQPIYLQPPVRC